MNIRALDQGEQERVIAAVERAAELGYAEDIARVDEGAARLRANSKDRVPDASGAPADELNAELDALAGGLGQHLQTATGSHWAALTDGVSSTIVLVGTVGGNQVVLYPFDIVERRWTIAEDGVFTRYFDEVIEQIRGASGE